MDSAIHCILITFEVLNIQSITESLPTECSCAWCRLPPLIKPKCIWNIWIFRYFFRFGKCWKVLFTLFHYLSQCKDDKYSQISECKLRISIKTHVSLHQICGATKFAACWRAGLVPPTLQSFYSCISIGPVSRIIFLGAVHILRNHFLSVYRPPFRNQTRHWIEQKLH